MADWSQLGQGFQRGYLLGKDTGGKKAGLGAAISKVADVLKQKRVAGEELTQKKNILGMEEASAVRKAQKQAEIDRSPEALEFERAKVGIQAQSPKVLAQGKRQNLVDSTKIREEFLNRPEVKEYTNISTQVNAMDSLLESNKNSPNKVAIDQALISMYNKLTDPNSVVRESEYARTGKNLPLFHRIEGLILKVEEGGAGLTDNDRNAIVDGAKIIADARGETYNQTLKEYVDLSGEYGIDESLITRGKIAHKNYNSGKLPYKTDNSENVNEATLEEMLAERESRKTKTR